MSKEDKDFIIEDSKQFLKLGWSIRKCYNAIKRTRVSTIKQKLAKYLDNDIRALELEKKGFF